MDVLDELGDTRLVHRVSRGRHGSGCSHPGCPQPDRLLVGDGTREAWRRVSVIQPAVTGTVMGKGWQGYLEAVDRLIDIVEATP
jgi:hypothetical protein